MAENQKSSTSSEIQNEVVSFNEQFHDNPLIKRFGTSELTVHHIKSLGTPNGKNKYQTWLTDDAVDIY